MSHIYIVLVQDAAATLQCRGRPNLDQAYGMSCMTKGLKADILASQSCLVKERSDNTKSCSSTDGCVVNNKYVLEVCNWSYIVVNSCSNKLNFCSRRQ